MLNIRSLARYFKHNLYLYQNISFNIIQKLKNLGKTSSMIRDPQLSFQETPDGDVLIENEYDCVIDSTYNDAFGLERFSFEATVLSRNFKKLKLFFFHLHFSISCLAYSILMLDFAFGDIRLRITVYDIAILWYVREAKYNLEKYYTICYMQDPNYLSIVLCIIRRLSFGEYLFESGYLAKNWIETSDEDRFCLKNNSISGGRKNGDLIVECQKATRGHPA